MKKSTFTGLIRKGIEYLTAAIVPIEIVASSALAKFGWISSDGLMENDLRCFFVTFSMALYANIVNANSRATIYTAIKSHKLALTSIQDHRKLARQHAYAFGASRPLGADIKSTLQFATLTELLLKKDRRRMYATICLLAASIGFFIASMLCTLSHDHSEHDHHNHLRRLGIKEFAFSELAHDFSLIVAIVYAVIAIVVDIFRSRTLFPHIDKCHRQTGALSSSVFASRAASIDSTPRSRAPSQSEAADFQPLHSLINKPRTSHLPRAESSRRSRSESPHRAQRNTTRIAPAPIETEDAVVSPN